MFILKPMLRQLLCAQLLGVSLSACSLGPATPIASDVGHFVKVQVDVSKATLENEAWRTSPALEIYRAPDANYIAVSRTDEFSVRITNVSGQRVVAVLTVDGANPNVDARSQKEGYVIEPGAFAQVFGRRTGPTTAEAFAWRALSHDSAYQWTYAPGIIKVDVFTEGAPTLPTGNSALPEAAAEAAGMNKQRREAEATVEPYSRSRPLEKCVGPDLRGQLPPSRVEVVTSPTQCIETPPSSPRPLQAKQATAWQWLLLHGGGQFTSTDPTRFKRLSAEPAEVVEIRYDDWHKLQKDGRIRLEKGRPVRGPASLW